MIFEFKNLYQAWKNVVVISSEDISKAKFRYFLFMNLFDIIKSIEDDTFTPTKLRRMTVLYPKIRSVQVPSIKDKIVENDICVRYFNKKSSIPLIKETCACIQGRGTDHCLKMVKQQLRHYYNVTGSNKFYVLKCDIKSYFASIPHDKLMPLIDRYVDDKDVKRLMIKFIGLMDEKGLALGLPQSQLLANLNLSDIDHFCKERIKPDLYNRYMDDFILVDRSKEKLEQAYKELKIKVENKGLLFNPKTRIVQNNFDYIGFNFRITETGKIIIRLSSKKKKQKRRHIKKMLTKLKTGEITIERFAEGFNGWRVHALKGDNGALIHSWTKWINKEIEPLGYRLSFNKNKVRIIYVKDIKGITDRDSPICK